MGFLTSGTVLVVGFSIGVMAVAIALSAKFWSDLSLPEESTSSTIRNIAVVVGGIIALTLSIWRSAIADRQADAARKQSEIAQNGLWNERYQKGAEMLGSDVLSVRLGGIYALERLAREQPADYHLPIVELFCAFVRNPTGRGDDRDVMRDRKPSVSPQLRVDVQEVMTAIGRRSEDGILHEERADGFELDLSGADLQGVSMSGCNFDGVKFNMAYLMHSWGMNVRLRDAKLHASYMYMATLPFADLSTANLSAADLSGANLTGARLKDAELSYTEFGKGKELVPSDDLTAEITYGDVYAKLTQAQLDTAKQDARPPPRIDPGTRDIDTHRPLVWRGGAASDVD